MTIEKNILGEELEIKPVGRLDTVTAPQLDAELEGSLGSVKKLVFNLEALDYISSAGLRVLLRAQKAMNKDDCSMVLRNVSPEIMEIFDITGFVDILTIE